MGDISSAIYTAAKAHQLSPELIAGVIMQESRGDPFSARYEEGFYKKYIEPLQPRELPGYKPTTLSADTEKRLRAFSFGLMQIMGNTARVNGFRGESLLILTDITTNLDLSCHILSKLIEKFSNVDEALFKYNAGEGTPYPGPQPRDYPSKVRQQIESNEIRRILE